VQNRVKPDPAARALLLILYRQPRAALEARRAALPRHPWRIDDIRNLRSPIARQLGERFGVNSDERKWPLDFLPVPSRWLAETLNATLLREEIGRSLRATAHKREPVELGGKQTGARCS
jgi:hypothetical protein